MRVVVKVGGSLMKAGVPDSLVRDAARLFPSNQLVLVHGGGDVVTEYATRLGKEQRFVVSPDGIRSRYTDRETAEIYQMVMSGYLAKRLVQALYAVGVKGVSLAGVDGSMISATRKSKLVIIDERGRKVVIDGGYTGRVRGVDPSLLDMLLGRGYLPIVSPLAQGEGGEPLNIDGDRAAASIAAGTGADVVVFATNVDGLSIDGALVGRLTAEEASASLPKIGFGMQKKVMAAVEAVRAGVREAVICSGTREGPITRAISHEGCTVVTR